MRLFNWPASTLLTAETISDFGGMWGKFPTDQCITSYYNQTRPLVHYMIQAIHILNYSPCAATFESPTGVAPASWVQAAAKQWVDVVHNWYNYPEWWRTIQRDGAFRDLLFSSGQRAMEVIAADSIRSFAVHSVDMRHEGVLLMHAESTEETETISGAFYLKRMIHWCTLAYLRRVVRQRSRPGFSSRGHALHD